MRQEMINQRSISIEIRGAVIGVSKGVEFFEASTNLTRRVERIAPPAVHLRMGTNTQPGPLTQFSIPSQPLTIVA